MFVANRRRDRAIALAERFGGASGSFDALPAELERADIVVSSTASPHAIIGAEELAEVMAARDGRPLLLVDLAVPRDIDPACAELRRRDAARHGRAADAGARGTSRVRRAEARARRGRSSRTRSRRSRAGSGRSRCCRRSPRCAPAATRSSTGCWPRTPAAGSRCRERDRERVEALARAIVNRLLHEPTRAREGRSTPSTATRACAAARAVRARRGGRGRRRRRTPRSAALPRR